MKNLDNTNSEEAIIGKVLVLFYSESGNKAKIAQNEKSFKNVRCLKEDNSI